MCVTAVWPACVSQTAVNELKGKTHTRLTVAQTSLQLLKTIRVNSLFLFLRETDRQTDNMKTGVSEGELCCYSCSVCQAGRRSGRLSGWLWTKGSSGSRRDEEAWANSQTHCLTLERLKLLNTNVGKECKSTRRAAAVRLWNNNCLFQPFDNPAARSTAVRKVIWWKCMEIQ